MAFITNNILFDLLGIFVALVAVLFVYVKRSFQYWEHRNVPYLTPSVPWGNLQPPHRNTIPVGEDLANIYSTARKRGWKYVGIYFLTEPFFMPLDLELVKHIMTKDFHHFVDRATYVNEKNEPINGHLLALGGKKWRDLRKIVTPTFTSGKIKHMIKTIARCGISLEQYLQNEADLHKPVDIKKVLACYTTDIIGSCAFGLDCNTFKEPDTPFTRFGQRVFKLNRLRRLQLSFTLIFPSVAMFLGVRLTEKAVADFYTKVVEDTVRYREKEKVTRPDFLQMMIDIKNENTRPGEGTRLTMNDIVAQSFVFFLAGYETSSTMITFVLYLLAIHPEIQEKVRDEIQSVLKKHNNQITYDALNDLIYMGQVINESLRLYPPASFVTRRCVADYKVPNSEVIIEKGTKVSIPIRGIHYDDEYFENPEVFDPERFIEENKQKRHIYAHIPFGEGPRICVGRKFGIMQSKVALVTILKNFRLKLSGKTKLPLKMSLESVFPTAEGGMWLKLERIKE